MQEANIIFKDCIIRKQQEKNVNDMVFCHHIRFKCVGCLEARRLEAEANLELLIVSVVLSIRLDLGSSLSALRTNNGSRGARPFCFHRGTFGPQKQHHIDTGCPKTSALVLKVATEPNTATGLAMEPPNHVSSSRRWFFPPR
jgi:hypothetical protein